MRSEVLGMDPRAGSPPPPQPELAYKHGISEAEPFLRRVPVRKASEDRETVSAAAAADDYAAGKRLSSFRQDVERAAAETYLITRLAFTLLRYLGVGYKWISKFLALALYAVLLLGGFMQVAYYYFFSRQVRRSVIYGELPRNRLDLYLPKDNGKNRRPCPVFAFVTGGAWIIGYKAWGSLLGKRLAERGIIVACIDYRNFPHGTISDMVRDASEGISFVCKNAASFGGDPNQLYVMGQSAGAHISACALVEQAIKESKGEETSWSISNIKAFFGLSGGYNMPSLVDHFHERGLYRKIFLRIMENEQSIRRFSPEIVVKEMNSTATSLLPPTVLIHGTDDYSIPTSASVNFADVLRSVGVQVTPLWYKGKTHTDLFLQDPLRGGRDQLVEDVLSVIYNHRPRADSEGNTHLYRRLVFEWQLQLARKISPF